MVRQSLSVEVQPPIDCVIDNGLVPRLIALLQCNNTTVQEEAAWALTNIASGSSQHTQFLINHGIVPNLISIICSPHPSVSDQAIWGIGNIAGDSTGMRNMVLENGGLTVLLKALKKHPSTSTLLRNSAWTLSNMFRGKPLPPQEYFIQALPTLDELLNSTDTEVLCDSLWCLSYVSDAPNEQIQTILMRPNIVQRLIAILSNPANTKSLINPALRSIGNFLTGDDVQTQMVLDAGALNVLKAMLSDAKTSIRKEACWCISNITSGTRDQIEMVLQTGIFPEIIRRASPSEDLYVRKEAIWALSNACCGGKREQIVHMVQAGLINCLFIATSWEDVTVVKVALEGLQHTVRSYETANMPRDLMIADFSDGHHSVRGRLATALSHHNREIHNLAKEIAKHFEDVDVADGIEFAELVLSDTEESEVTPMHGDFQGFSF
eukprot:gene13299-15631_t